MYNRDDVYVFGIVFFGIAFFAYWLLIKLREKGRLNLGWVLIVLIAFPSIWAGVTVLGQNYSPTVNARGLYYTMLEWYVRPFTIGLFGLIGLIYRKNPLLGLLVCTSIASFLLYLGENGSLTYGKGALELYAANLFIWITWLLSVNPYFSNAAGPIEPPKQSKNQPIIAAEEETMASSHHERDRQLKDLEAKLSILQKEISALKISSDAK